MEFQTNFYQLKELLGEVSDLRNAAAVLSWDQQTYMPRGGATARGQQMATLRKLAHLKFTSDTVGKLLDELKPVVEQMDPDSDEARTVKVVSRRFDKSVKVPADFVAEFARITSIGHVIWEEARAKNDFALFLPHLEKIVEKRQQYAQFFAPFDHIYDPLLDDYEPGLKTADVQAIFTALRPQQVELIKTIAERPQVDNSFLHQPFDEKKQWDFSVEVATQFGYDWTRGRQDKVVHPFCTSFSIDDVRITTRVYPNFLNPCLFGTMHETGHALYNMGVNHAYERTPLTGGASLAVHESQSRMWENLVGRSYPFWEFFYHRLQEVFPGQLGNIPLDTFYKGINRVEPSLIRVEADEATYNLHIMLRLELEIALMEGKVAARDLPEAWNSRMQAYLGLTPPNDSEGVLQDVHWSGGMIGYFSTYALGNLIGLQLWEKINQAIPGLADQVRQGKFETLLGWLRQNVHQYGSKFEPQELVQKVTGSKIDPAPYLRYLKEKFSQIYGL